MMKSVGIFACNYNKVDFIKKCVGSVLLQTFTDYDLYVIDNASTDGSAEELQKTFGDRINIIKNEKNIGGSGGFNVGLRRGMELGYKYIMLLDNDVALNPDVVGTLFHFMESNHDTGIAGAKILLMKKPNLIQEYGSFIDFEGYRTKLGFHLVEDNSSLPDTVSCDFSPACACMIRTEALDKTGLLPEDNFIYWDDMELGFKMGIAGYKVKSVGAAKAWHNFNGLGAKENGFIRYYSIRNKIHFFGKYLLKEQMDSYASYVLRDAFSRLYGDYHRREYDCMMSTLYAVNDAVYGISGKADDYKINLTQVKGVSPFEKILKDASVMIIKMDDSLLHREGLAKYLPLYRVMQKIKDSCKDIRVCLSSEILGSNPQAEKNILQKVFVDEADELEFIGCSEKDGLSISLCSHVKTVKEYSLPDIYVDEWLNCISNRQDFEYFSKYQERAQLFEQFYKPLLIAHFADKDKLNEISGMYSNL